MTSSATANHPPFRSLLHTSNLEGKREKIRCKGKSLKHKICSFCREKLPGWNDPPPLTSNSTGSSSGQGYKLNKRVGYPTASDTAAAAGTVPGQIKSTVTKPGYVLPLSTPPMIQVSKLSTLILSFFSPSLSRIALSLFVFSLLSVHPLCFSLPPPWPLSILSVV